MSDAASAMDALDLHAGELDSLSKLAAEVERELEPIEREYQDFLDVFEVGCWDRHVKDGDKLPSEAMREKLARRELPTVLLGKYSELTSRRKRIEKRIAALKTQISAQQSILSAHKLEAEASGQGLRRAA
jgi:IS4 transposase